jgi:hypothetical protein
MIQQEATPYGRPSPPRDYGERLGLALLSVGDANRCSEVFQPVPDFDDDQQPMLIKAQEHVHRERWIGGPGWQLEMAVVSVTLSQPEHELLQRKMAGVSGRRGQ